LIFDLDGTLADTAPIHQRAFSIALEPFGLTVDYPTVAGLRTEDAISRITERHAVKLPTPAVVEIAAVKRRMARDLMLVSLDPIPGATEFVRGALDHFKLSLYSAGSRTTVRLTLKRIGLADVFHPVITGDDVAHGKPDPEGFRAAMMWHNTVAPQAMVFEDSDAGLEAGRRAGTDLLQLDHERTVLEKRRDGLWVSNWQSALTALKIGRC